MSPESEMTIAQMRSCVYTLAYLVNTLEKRGIHVYMRVFRTDADDSFWEAIKKDVANAELRASAKTKLTEAEYKAMQHIV